MFVLKELQPEAGRIKLKEYKKTELKEIMEAFAQITASAHLRMAGSPGCSVSADLKDFLRMRR